MLLLNATNDRISVLATAEPEYAPGEGCLTFDENVIDELTLADTIRVDVRPGLTLLNSILNGDADEVNSK